MALDTASREALAHAKNTLLEISKDEVGESAVMYEHAVRHALDQLPGNQVPVRTLIADIERGTAEIVPILRVLCKNIPKLDTPTAVPLVEALLDVKWGGSSPTPLVEGFVRFLGILASGIPQWWSEIASRSVKKFVLPLQETQPQHTVLMRILQLIPTSSTRMGKILSVNFPHTTESTQATTNYVSNLLHLLDYAPEQARVVWQLIIEKVMQIDVECDDEDESDSDGESESESDEEDGDSESEGEVASSEDNLTPPSKRRRLSHIEEGTLIEGEEVTETQLSPTSFLQQHDKLDALVVYLLRYLEIRFTAEKVASGEATPLFIMLLDIFKDIVLPTHTTRAVQFIIFHVAHAHQDLLDAFLAAIIEEALNPKSAVSLRQKAMQYIASFLARSRGLSRNQIVFVVSFLGTWLSRYTSEREIEVDAAQSMARFRMFYSAVQALFYIFCFRHESLRRENGVGWEGDIDKLFERLVASKFNPLKYCKSTVVAMFARIARSENVTYCFTIMEQNRLGKLRQSNETIISDKNNTGRSSILWSDQKEFVQLDSYFPFDPLTLRGARKFIAPEYIEWAEVSHESESDSDDDDVDSFSSEEEDF